jgi:hypothetical protein
MARYAVLGKRRGFAVIGMTSLSRVLLVHMAFYVAVALGLLVMASPVNWQTPTNLWAQEDVAFLVVVVLVVAGILGSLEGVSLALGHRVPGWLFAALALAVGGSGASFYVQAPFAYGDETWTASREDVVMSQLVWFGFWGAHTLVACAVLASASRRRAAPAGGTVTAGN